MSTYLPPKIDADAEMDRPDECGGQCSAEGTITLTIAGQEVASLACWAACGWLARGASQDLDGSGLALWGSAQPGGWSSCDGDGANTGRPRIAPRQNSMEPSCQIWGAEGQDGATIDLRPWLGDLIERQQTAEEAYFAADDDAEHAATRAADEALRAAEEIGFPVFVKAVAGGEFHERIESLDSRLSKAFREASDLRNIKDNLEKNYANLKANTVVLTAEYHDLKCNFDQRLAQEIAKYAANKDAETTEYLQDKELEMHEKVREFAKQWDAALRAKQSEIENKEAIISEYQAAYQAAKESDTEIEQEFYNLERKITHLNALAGAKDEEIHRLSRASLKLDATFPTGTYAADLGNQILAFYRARKIEIAPIAVTPKPSGIVEIILQPFGSNQSDLERYAEDLYYEFKPLSQPSFDKQDGYLKLSIKAGVNERESKVKEAASDYFEQALKRVFHIRVTGETDTGKSTLVSNLVGLILSQNPDCEVSLYNPLYGSKYDSWQIPAKWRTFDAFPAVIGEIESEFERRS